MEMATKFYKDVLQQDNMNVEAIACIATHYFYTDQPEIALKFYRQENTCTLRLKFHSCVYRSSCTCFIRRLKKFNFR